MIFFRIICSAYCYTDSWANENVIFVWLWSISVVFIQRLWVLIHCLGILLTFIFGQTSTLQVFIRAFRWNITAPVDSYAGESISKRIPTRWWAVWCRNDSAAELSCKRSLPHRPILSCLLSGPVVAWYIIMGNVTLFGPSVTTSNEMEVYRHYMAPCRLCQWGEEVFGGFRPLQLR